MKIFLTALLVTSMSFTAFAQEEMADDMMMDAGEEAVVPTMPEKDPAMAADAPTETVPEMAGQSEMGKGKGQPKMEGAPGHHGKGHMKHKAMKKHKKEKHAKKHEMKKMKREKASTKKKNG